MCIIGCDLFVLGVLLLKLFEGKDEFFKDYLLSYVRFGSNLSIKFLRVCILGREFSFVILLRLLFCFIFILEFRLEEGVFGLELVECIFVKFWFLKRLERFLMGLVGVLL